MYVHCWNSETCPIQTIFKTLCSQKHVNYFDPKGQHFRAFFIVELKSVMYYKGTDISLLLFNTSKYAHSPKYDVMH